MRRSVSREEDEITNPLNVEWRCPPSCQRILFSNHAPNAARCDALMRRRAVLMASTALSKSGEDEPERSVFKTYAARSCACQFVRSWPDSSPTFASDQDFGKCLPISYVLPTLAP